MHIGQAGYAACGRNWTDKRPATAVFFLPPDVEPPPERVSDAPRRWLAARHIAACDRAPACKGLSIGEAIGEAFLSVVGWFERTLTRSPHARIAASTVVEQRSLPRIRRSQFHRRARALQFRATAGR